MGTNPAKTRSLISACFTLTNWEARCGNLSHARDPMFAPIIGYALVLSAGVHIF